MEDFDVFSLCADREEILCAAGMKSNHLRTLYFSDILRDFLESTIEAGAKRLSSVR